MDCVILFANELSFSSLDPEVQDEKLMFKPTDTDLSFFLYVK